MNKYDIILKNNKAINISELKIYLIEKKNIKKLYIFIIKVVKK
tara:strand:- start:161 stop:289 length:129 start_codon:yes stop_codon:yes gene_type:complete